LKTNKLRKFKIRLEFVCVCVYVVYATIA
jgi:hypothetical protein